MLNQNTLKKHKKIILTFFGFTLMAIFSQNAFAVEVADTFEIDDSFAQARAITFGETQSHTIHALSDQDFLSVSLSQPMNALLFSTSLIRGVLPSTAIFDSNFNQISGIQLGGVAPGTYYVRVTPFPGSIGEDAYNIALLPSTPRVGDTFEDDNNFAQSRSISSGETQTHSIHFRGDNDYLTFSLAASSNVQIRLNAEPITEIAGPPTTVSLYNESQALISEASTTVSNRIVDLNVQGLATGNYFIRVREANAANHTASYEYSVSLTASPTPVGNQIPIPSITALSINGLVTGTAITFDGSGSRDPDGTVTSYAWSITGPAASTCNTLPTNSAFFICTFTTAGTYNVTLVLTDNSGGIGQQTVGIGITAAAGAPTGGPTGPQPPTARITFTPTTGITTATTVTFSGATSTDPFTGAANPITAYIWTINNTFALAPSASCSVDTSNAAQFICTFATAGTYGIDLTVRNTFGITNSTTATVTVSAPVAAETSGSGGGGGGSSAGPSGTTSGGAGGVVSIIPVTATTDGTPLSLVEEPAAPAPEPEAPVELLSAEIVPPFDDVPEDHWAFEFIEELRLKGLIEGRGPGKYEPEMGLTRAEITKLAIKLFAIEIDETMTITQKPFDDVAVDQWYSQYIVAGKKAGIIRGYGKDGKIFKPEQIVSRAEALQILFEAGKIKYQENSLSAKEVVDKFADIVYEEAWYNKYIGFAVVAKIAEGYSDGSFKPEQFVTRAEIAKIISMVLKLEAK